MSSKDESVFSKDALMHTDAGKDILKQAMLRSDRYRQFQHYKELADAEMPRFIERFVRELHSSIINDTNPIGTLRGFIREAEPDGFMLERIFMMDEERVKEVRSRLADQNRCRERLIRLLDSNYVKMTYPVFYALFDGACSYLNINPSEVERDVLVDGHIIAIDLSEPMDRIMDGDEDVEYLDDYRLMCPYMLKIARRKISSIGKDILESFERGFRDAKHGQYVDLMLKNNPSAMDEESMHECYKKYRAVMGTAGRNMVLRDSPLRRIFYHGMARAGESVGCANEIEDSIRGRIIKVPSWPLYYALNTGDVRLAFDLTFRKSRIYLDDALIAIDMLPDRFSTKHFLEFMVLSVRHYNEYWYRRVKEYDLNIFTSGLKER
ncbi:MAG: hypothetical protein NZ888_03460 [Candidatus Nitrosocaldus sp.]|nr:hypothetical protein [Candidatus Nitrosocaldus sp.]MDW8000167.1 hypothetical protein [Candidatus Nitrosocaldus sp.]